MKTKFENLGTALSREQAKKIVGGDDGDLSFDDLGGGTAGSCKTDIHGHCYCSNGNTAACNSKCSNSC
jgi:hypothetical protein